MKNLDDETKLKLVYYGIIPAVCFGLLLVVAVVAAIFLVRKTPEERYTDCYKRREPRLKNYWDTECLKLCKPILNN